MNTISYLFILTALLISGPAMAQNQDKLKALDIQKTVRIKADLQTVFNQVAYLENFPNWSPFLEADPEQQIEVRGTDGQVGAQYHWTGNGGKDLGYQEIASLTSGQQVLLQCDIQKPFEATPTFTYHFEQNGDYILVTQDFHLPVNGVDLFFMKLFGGVKDIHTMNTRGLELLKQACES